MALMTLFARLIAHMRIVRIRLEILSLFFHSLKSAMAALTFFSRNRLCRGILRMTSRTVLSLLNMSVR